MKIQAKDILISLLITLFTLAILEVFSTAFLPVIGIENYRLSFHILVILYLGFKLETPTLAVLVFVIQYFHSFFSIEGWAMGTFAGVLICMLIGYLKDLIHFSTTGMTILVNQIFQTAWFIIVSGLIYLKTGNSAYILEKLWKFLPESIALSLLSPLLFMLLDRIWKLDHESLLKEQS